MTFAHGTGQHLMVKTQGPLTILVRLRRFRRVTHLYLAEVIQGRNSIGRGRDI